MIVSETPDKILYVKSINSEWKLDSEAVIPSFRERWESLAELQSTGSAWSYLSNLTCKYNLDCQAPEVLKIIEDQSAWRIILSNSKEQLAVLQDGHIEIRSAENDFTEVSSRWVVPTRDLFPQWRNLAWSPCDSLVAYSDSRGNVFLYGINGDQLSHVVQPKNQGCDLGNAVCCLTFKGRRSLEQQADDNEQHWLHELLVVTYEGVLHTFIISQEGDHQPIHTFNFDGGYPNGIVDARYVPTCDMLLVGGGAFWRHGVPADQSDRDEMWKHGLSAWRVLSGHPYYKLVSDCDAESATGLKKFSPGGWRWPWSGQRNGDKVLKMAVSPDCKTLVSVHASENVCVWSLPSLKLVKKFSLVDQPCRDYVDPTVLENPKKVKAYKDLLNAFHIVSLAWWSNEDIIISRGTGSLTVSNVENLTNRLGTSPEFFRSKLNLMRFSDGCFYILECQKKFGPPKRDVEESNFDGSQSEEEEEEDNSEGSTGRSVARLLRQGLYYVTDFETFRPQKKRSRLMRRTYRMICFKSTTPEELYSNMLDGEEYEEALSLARKYNLDCDLTYQKQWKKSPVTVSTIQDFLRKITKRSWVLHECMESVPDELEAMEELLKYGLRGTDLEAVVAAGRDDDDGRFVFCESFDDYKPLDGDDDDDDDAEESRAKEEKRRKELMKMIAFKNLTFNQKELCRIRLKLLQYLDRLETYKDILKRKDSSFEKYDKSFFKSLRKENIVRLAVESARLSDVAALESIFSYHGDEVLPHRLSILWNIPETTMPDCYSRLLPKIWITDKERVVDDWKVLRWRDQSDWSEQFFSTQNLISSLDSGEFLYEENPDLLEFRGRSLSDGQMTSWFRRRSLEIEKMSGQVDCACNLLSIGIKNNVQDLEALHEDFILMETLVYECQISPTFTFDSLSKMSPMERIRKMMAKTSREMFIRNMKRWVVPYLKQRDEKSRGSYHSLLRNYLVGMAEGDLTNVELIVKECKHDKLDPMIGDVHQLYSISADCIYSHAGFDQLFMIRSIVQNLPEVDEATEESKLKISMSKHLLGAETLKRNGIEQTPSQIRDVQKSEAETTQLLTRLARISAKKTPPMSQSELELLLSDMCLLQENVFSNISKTKTYEIFVGSLLCSGNMSHIQLGGKVMNSSLDPSSPVLQRQTTPRPSVTSSIKDSLKSFTRSTPPSSSNLPSIPSEFVDCAIGRPKCIDLILQAAREYFNSSADFLHENMKLAKSCLELMPERPPELQEELNLIEALAMLKFHGISEFPAHLRMAEDRLKYVKDVLKKKSMVYKNYSKLLELGRLLKIGKGYDRLLQGQIFDLVAQHALEAKDYSICLDACKKLMSLNYAEGWNACRCLAEEESFSDDSSRYELFDFTLLHSPDSDIDGVLESFSKFQAKALCREVSRDVTSVDPSVQTTPGRSGGPASLKSIENVLIGQTKQVFSLTKAAFDHIGDTQWWSGVVGHAATGIKRLAVPEVKRMRRSIRSGSIDKGFENRFTKQTRHPFFNSTDNVSTSFARDDMDVIDAYTKDKTVDPVVAINEQLLRIYLINRAGSGDDENGKSSELVTQVLLMLAENVLPRDTSLGMLYLLALPDPFSSETCFDKLPKTPLSYQLAMYFYAMKISLWLKTSGMINLPDLVDVCPKSLIRHVEQQAGKLDGERKRLYERMSRYKALLLDHQESTSLKNLGRGIDTSRFNSDDSYKKETILGMALSLDDGLLSSALNLAGKYGLQTRDVYVAHLGFLFDDSSDLTAEQIEERIKKLNVLKELNENPTWFARTMRDQIFPLIEGGDLDRLLVYYSCLAPDSPTNEDEDVSHSSQKGDGQFEDIKPSTHVKMIKKFRNVALGVNYKNLFSGTCSMEDVLNPIISSSNVATFAKYSQNYVDKKGRIIDSGFVHRCHASKVFNAPVYGCETDWGEKFKACLESLQTMSPKVLNEFVDENLFGPSAVRRIPMEGRKQVLKLVMKHSKQQLSAARKSNQQDASSWEEMVQILQRDLDHLNKMSSKTISRLLASDNDVWQKYATEFDLTQSGPNEVKRLVKKMILSPESVEFVGEFIKNLSLHEILLQDLYLEVLQELSSTSEKRDFDRSLDKIRQVLAEISRHEPKGSSQVVDLKELCTRLKDFVSGSNIDAHFKLGILSVIKENSRIKDDAEDILYSQTCAVLSMLNSDVQITSERISREAERILIFNDLLENLSSVEQLSELGHLLKIWPCFENSDENLRLKLLKKLIASASDDEESLKKVLPIVLESIEGGCLNEKEIDQLFDIMASIDPLEACKMLISTSNKALNDKALASLQSMSSDTKDEHLFLLLLKRQLLPRCTSLPFYHNLFDFTLTCDTSGLQSSDDDESVKGLVHSALKDMSSTGQKAEAGSLYMPWRSVHRGLRTFDAAINFVDKFLSK